MLVARAWFDEAVALTVPVQVKTAHGNRTKLSWLVGVSTFWFATSYKWFLILVFLLPDRVASIVPGGEKGAYWGAVFGLGATWAVVGPALFGDFSDRVGDRRPFILVGWHRSGEVVCV